MVNNELMELKRKRIALELLANREKALARERKRINDLQENIRKNKPTTKRRVLLRKAFKETVRTGLKIIGSLEVAGGTRRKRRVRVRRRRR